MCDKVADSDKGKRLTSSKDEQHGWIESCSDSPSDNQWYVNITNKCSTPVCVVLKDGGDDDNIEGYIELSGNECKKYVHNDDNLKFSYYDNSGVLQSGNLPVDQDQAGCDSGQKSGCGRMKPIETCGSGTPTQPKKKWYEGLKDFFYTKYGIITGVMVVVLVFLAIVGVYLYMEKKSQMQSQQMLMAAFAS